MRNLAIYIPSLVGWRGAIRAAIGLCNGLSARGVPISVVTPAETQGAGQKPEPLYELTPDIPRVEIGNAWSRGFSERTCLQQAEYLSDAVSPGITLIVVNWWDAYVARLAGVETIIHWVSYPTPPSLTWLDGTSLPRDFDCASHYVAMSRWAGRVLKDRLGADAAVVPLFVAPAFLGTDAGHAERSPAGVALYVGPFDTMKGIEDLLEVFTRREKVSPDLELWIATQDSPPNNVRLPGSARLHRPRSDRELAACYAAAEMVIVPSYFETFGLVGIESMAMGTPLIQSRCGGPDDYAVHGVNCLAFAPGDREGLRQAIASIRQDPIATRQRVLRGLETATRFTLDGTLDRWAAFMLRLGGQDRA